MNAIEKHTCTQCDEIAAALNGNLDSERFIVWHTCRDGSPATLVRLQENTLVVTLNEGEDLRQEIAKSFRNLADHVEAALGRECQCSGLK